MSELTVTWEDPVAGVLRLRQNDSLRTTIYAFQHQGQWVLVDTGVPGGEGALLNRLDEAGMNVSAVLLTHSHATHVAAARPLAERGATVWAHALEADAIRRMGIPVHRTFVHGDGMFGLVVHHAPGHAPGNVAFVKPGEVCFAGDVVMGLGPDAEKPLRFPSADPAAPPGQIRRDIEALLRYPFEALFPAHGRQVTSDAHTAIRRLLEPGVTE